MAQAAALADAPPRRVRVHVVLLLITLASTTLGGVMLSARPGQSDLATLRTGLAFAIALLAILLSHEMGHYVFARIHRVETTLPYVIPFPPYLPFLGMVSFGTLGAVIRMRSKIPTRDALIDVGASGPIAGVVVALPLLALGLSWSQVVQSPAAGQSFWIGHQSLWSLTSALLSHAQTPPSMHHVDAMGDNLLMRVMERLVFGKLLPGQDVSVHPVAIAAWFGLLVTSLNLFPIGQLDGGHVSYAVLGERGHRWLGRAVSTGLLVLAVLSSVSWLLWFVVTTRFIGFAHPPVEQQAVKVGSLRLAISLVALGLLIATFVPVPMDQI